MRGRESVSSHRIDIRFERIGRSVAQYNITETIGEGGMGIVYKAEDNNSAGSWRWANRPNRRQYRDRHGCRGNFVFVVRTGEGFACACPC